MEQSTDSVTMFQLEAYEKNVKDKKSIKHGTEDGNKSRKEGKCKDFLKMYKGTFLFFHEHSLSYSSFVFNWAF